MKKIILSALTLLLSSGLAHSQTELWGVTYRGGTTTGGNIYKTDLGGNNLSSEYSSNLIEGVSPAKTYLCEASNGNLYGVTSSSGASNKGVLFEYNPSTSIYTNKLSFDGTTQGAYPSGSLIEANGKLYSVTSNGGANNIGVLYEFNPNTNTYVVLHDFDGSATGSQPTGSLFQASNGKLYGTTKYGGTNSKGVLFEYDLNTNTLTKKADFIDQTTGTNPTGRLMQASNGHLYGTSSGAPSSGGYFYNGIIYEYNLSTNTLTAKALLLPCKAKLIELGGKLYGATSVGGQNYSNGAIFDYDLNTSQITTVYNFQTTTGKQPNNSLMLGANGNFYGLTLSGGVNSEGTLFEYDLANSTYTKLVDFDDASKGKTPNDTRLITASNGKFYGLTSQGGAYVGTLFEYDLASDIFIKKVDFLTDINGHFYGGGLVKANDGQLYGLAEYGGTTGKGVLYKINPNNGNYTKVHDFSDATGSRPKGALIKASNGKLFGVTQIGGANGLGVIFEFDPATNIYSELFDFDATTSGYSPLASLVEASNGKLYGTTSGGGANGGGTIFEYNINTNVYTNKYDFITAIGYNSTAALIESSYNNKLYGVTQAGGSGYNGVLFEYDYATNSYTKLEDFGYVGGQSKGKQPATALLEVSNGVLYGVTPAGGANDDGVIYEYNIATSTYTKKIEFATSTNGLLPESSLIKATNGLLYGTANGGTNNKGILFEYNHTTNIFVTKQNFTGLNGNSPKGFLLEITPCVATSSSMSVTACASYTAPSGAVHTSSGSITDVIPNAEGCDSTITINLTVIPPLTGTHTETVCDGASIVVNGTTYDANNLSGTEVFSNIGVNNCDSTVTVSLTVLASLSGTHTETVCNGGSTIVNGTTYDANNLSGTEVFSNIGSNGCDSTVTVSLTVLAPVTGTHTETVCDGGSTIVNGTTYDANNVTGTEVFSNIGTNGCDSIVTVSLTVLAPLTGTHTETVCDGGSTIVNGTTYDANNLTGTEVFTNVGASGCDSTVTVNLTIAIPIDVTTSINGDIAIANNTTATSYQWLDCNNGNSIISGAINSSFTAVVNGSYAVEITEGNCTETSNCVNIVSVSIKETTQNLDVNIYPNPTTGKVTFTTSGISTSLDDRIETIEIYNLAGQKVAMFNNTNTIDISKLSNGIYSAKVVTGKGITTKKIIKE